MPTVKDFEAVFSEVARRRDLSSSAPEPRKAEVRDRKFGQGLQSNFAEPLPARAAAGTLPQKTGMTPALRCPRTRL